MPNMIVAPQPLAVEEGAKVLQAGGNAVDAAVTCAFVQMILSPHSCGIGGYVLLNLQLAGATEPQAIVLDAPALAGARTTPDMWEDIVIGPNPLGWGFFLEGKVNDQGYQSICTPGTVKALAAILERWGTRSFADAIEPAARIAEEGFVVQESMARNWRMKAPYPEASAAIDYIRSNPEARRIYLREDGEPYDTGDHLSNPDYARTLRHLAAHGPEDFYTGELAETLVRDLAANGSFVTAEDLAGYELRDERTVWGTYHDYTVASVPAPHGGPTLIEILNILEGYDLAALGHNSPEYLYLLAMAMKAAFADRNPYFGDPAFVDVPEEWVMSKERAQHWRDQIDSAAPIEVAFALSGSPDTTHVSTVDAAGNCVALTHSLGVSSGVITPGHGFMWNNSMINFHPYGGHPNSIAPGKARTTGMCPTIVYRDGKQVLSIGAPGATRIITSIAQVILNVVAFGMSVSDAVLAPRIDCEVGPIRAQARIPEYVCSAVRKRHPIERIPFSHGGFALVHAIAAEPDTGRLTGGADTGAGGMALEV